MANFSFDWGDVHWTVLDANQYVDWTNPELRDWVARDLASASARPWRLVAFHQPGFNSSVAHFYEQQMRLLADVFEAGGVAVAFGGHVHEYQRTKPLTFKVRPGADGRLQAPNGQVEGEWALDRDLRRHDPDFVPSRRDLRRHRPPAERRCTTSTARPSARPGRRSPSGSARPSTPIR